MPCTATRVVATASDSGKARYKRDRGRQASPRQPDFEPAAAPDQAALDCPDRPIQSKRRLFVREPLERAEHDRQALGVAQPVDLFMDDGT